MESVASSGNCCGELRGAPLMFSGSIAITGLRLKMKNSRTLGRSRSIRQVGFQSGTIALLIVALVGVWGCGGGSSQSQQSALAKCSSDQHDLAEHYRCRRCGFHAHDQWDQFRRSFDGHLRRGSVRHDVRQLDAVDCGHSCFERRLNWHHSRDSNQPRIRRWHLQSDELHRHRPAVTPSRRSVLSIQAALPQENSSLIQQIIC